METAYSIWALIFAVVNNECLLRKKKGKLWPLINLFWSGSLIGNANSIDTAAVSLTRYPRWFVKLNKLPLADFQIQLLLYHLILVFRNTILCHNMPPFNNCPKIKIPAQMSKFEYQRKIENAQIIFEKIKIPAQISKFEY